MEIYERMFMIMDEKGIISADLAKKLGVSRGTVTNWKSRGTNPPADYIVVICELLEVDIEYFLSGKTKTLNINYDEKNLIEHYRLCNTENKKQLNSLAKSLSQIAITEEQGNSSTSKVGWIENQKNSISNHDATSKLARWYWDTF